MKRTILLVIIFLLVATFVYGQLVKHERVKTHRIISRDPEIKDRHYTFAAVAFNAGNYHAAFNRVLRSRCPHGFLLLSHLLLEGKGCEQNIKLGLTKLRNAADGRLLKAIKLLATYYYQGIYLEQDKSQALKWYEKAAHRGDYDSMMLSARMYINGEGTDVNHQKALEYYLLAAETHKEAKAYFNLGSLYQSDFLGSPDYEKALHYYSLAAEKGDPKAHFYLGVAYQDGIIIKRDNRKAFEHFFDSAKGEYPDAYIKVAIYFHNGQFVEKNIEKSLSWFEKATEIGDSFAICKLGEIYYSGNGVQKNLGKAFTLFSQAAELGESDALFNLGVMYYKGIYVRQDVEEAIELWKKAVLLQNQRAIKALKQVEK